MKMRLLHVRFDGPTVALLDQVLAGVQERCPGSPVTHASIIRESVHRTLHDRSYLRQLGLVAEGDGVRVRGRR
jgi:hypothetical protein